MHLRWGDNRKRTNHVEPKTKHIFYFNIKYIIVKKSSYVAVFFPCRLIFCLSSFAFISLSSMSCSVLHSKEMTDDSRKYSRRGSRSPNQTIEVESLREGELKRTLTKQKGTSLFFQEKHSSQCGSMKTSCAGRTKWWINSD